MKKNWMRALALLLALLTLSGCKKMPEQEQTVQTTETIEETAPPTVPANGDPNDVTCMGSYTGRGDEFDIAALVGDAELTNGMLNVFYWGAVAEYRASGQEPAPDFDRPLDTQPCSIDDSVNSWQQYFLGQALNSWHTAQALKLQGDAEGLEAEAAYKPNLDNHQIYLTDIPAMNLHYSYNLETYHPNTLHQSYLDNIPETLKQLAKEKGYQDAMDMASAAFGASLEDLQDAVEICNRGYMYFTTLSYGVRATQEEVDIYAASDAYSQRDQKLVNLRHILMVPDDLVEEDTTPVWEQKNTEPTEPVVLEAVKINADGTVSCSEEAWTAEAADAQALLDSWLKNNKRTEFTFAELARQNSDDPGSAINGGAYYRIRQGQLKPALDAWCFDEARVPGDTTILRSDYGFHILYFSGRVDAADVRAEEDLNEKYQTMLIAAAREKYPMTVRYEAVSLEEAAPGVSISELLYPDVAHERYPEAPVFLQQDYQGVMFGGDELRTNGCGITTLSMLATYMTDEEYTPPEMCARYGNYSYQGTDGRIFQLESPVLGFYCKEKTYEPNVAKKALEEGYPVVSLQHKGYWTRGGHYILVEKMNEDGTVQVRDSNIYNYGKLDGHKVDRFDWKLIPANGSGFWIFEKKVTAIPACSRCGVEEAAQNLLADQFYICEKCTVALLRRNTYLTAGAQ